MPIRNFTVTGIRTARRRDRGAHDGPQQRRLRRHGGAAALAGDLGYGAAEVEVEVVGQALADEPAHGLTGDVVEP